MTIRHQRDRAIGVLVKSARIKSKLSQAELALLLGYPNPQYVSNVERGVCKMPLGWMPVLRRAIGIDENLILNLHTRFMKQFVKERDQAWD